MKAMTLMAAAFAAMGLQAAAFAGAATATDGSFEFKGAVDLEGIGGGETLCELPGFLRLVVRQAGKDPALVRYDREFGNYLNFPLADGSAPVLEAEFPNARHSLAPWYLKELPPGCRIGVPLAVLPAKKGPRAFRVVCAKTRVRLYVDDALYDEELLVAPLAPTVGSELRARSPRLVSAELAAPAPADAFGKEPDERPVEGPIQYWTSDGYNTWVGDVVCCRFGGRLHVFYLKDRRHHRSKGGSGGHGFAHISTADLVHWTAHPDAVPVEDWWMSVGTGTPFELDGKLCLSYGVHSTRFVPLERTTEPAMFAEYERTGVMPRIRFAGTDLVPLGATWSESSDGIHFRPSGIVFHTTQNPGIQNLPDGRLKLVTGFFQDVGAKGVFVSRGTDGWKAVDDPNPLSGDCPCPFEWNGYRYLLQGFCGYARAKGDAPLAKAPGSDIYDGLGVPMVAPWGENRRLLIGWLRHHYGWGGWLVFRELVQREDGSLGTKWVDEIRPPAPVVTARAKAGARFVRDFTRADGRETIRLTVDPKSGAAFLSAVAADGKERRRSILTLLGDSPVTGIRGLERDYAVRYVLHYDRKADTTIFDAEIAGNRTVIDEWPGRFGEKQEDVAAYDVAAYVWPAYQPEPRWAELGIFAKGVGEWQNVQEAVPKWKGHHQPLEPLWGYENEADPKVVEHKIDAAVAAGVNVFIYDWYWYGGRPFLENGINEGFLKAKNCEKMKFFIMWANHHVNKLWDNRVADKQWNNPTWRGWVDEEEFKTLVKRWLAQYFTRPNYYRIGGKPVLMIYEIRTFIEGVGGLDKAVRSIAYLREACAEAGLGGVHLMACDFGVSAAEVKALGIDSATIYNFVHWSSPNGNPDYADWAAKGARRFDAAKASLGLKAYFAHASVGWDTNPRYPKETVQSTAIDSTPEKFEAVLRRAKDWCDANTAEGMPRLITVNSWNEWTEGSYLEPDRRFGFGYLDAIRRVLGPGRLIPPREGVSR